jgi:SAM-dependent methyltransferase
MESGANGIKERQAARRRSVTPKPVSFAQEPPSGQADAFDAETRGVKDMYEQFPYPSPVTTDGLIGDLSIAIGMLFPRQDLAGWNILDAGCGTGHRMLALAREYPKAHVTGIDMTEASLAAAAERARVHQLANVSFERRNLLTYDPPQKFDLIVSTGVIHHLTNPLQGLSNLRRGLRDTGVIFIWLYHPFGEFDRLLDRELMRLLWGADQSDLREGVALMDDLRLNLSGVRYGSRTATASGGSTDQTSVNVDAYLHPVVNAYRFAEAAAMFRDAGLHWAAVYGVNYDGHGHLVDLGDERPLRGAGIDPGELFTTERLLTKYRGLDKEGKLRALELALRPTGFSIVGGLSDSLQQCEPRASRNALTLR